MYRTGAQAAGGGSAQQGLQGYWKRLLDYAFANPVKTLSVTVLAYGGLLLLVYFARISFLPDVNLDALASVLYAVALVGLLLAGYTATTLVLPGLVLGGCLDDGSLTKPQVAWVATISALVWMLLVIGLLFEFGNLVWLTSVLMAVIALLALGLWRVWVRPNGGIRQPLWAAAMVLVCTVLMTVPMALISALGLHGDLAHSRNWSAAVALSCTAFGIAATALMVGATERPKRWRYALLIAPSMLLVFSMVTGSFSAISVVAVSKLGLGEQHFVRAVVSGKTCKVVNEALGQAVCDPKAEEGAATTICPVVLRSRIGSQVLLEFASLELVIKDGAAQLKWKTAGKDAPFFARVVLPKEQLLTWSSLQPVAKSASAPASDVLASWLPEKRGGAMQPDALAKALAAVCRAPGEPKVPEPGTSASGPVTAASAPTLIQIDAKGSASHQTVVNVQLQNAVSQNASALSAAGARSGADAKVLIRRPSTQTPKCSPATGSASCCRPVCCGAPVQGGGNPAPACAASAPD